MLQIKIEFSPKYLVQHSICPPDGKDDILSTPKDHTPPLSIVIALAEHPVLGGGVSTNGSP